MGLFRRGSGKSATPTAAAEKGFPPPPYDVSLLGLDALPYFPPDYKPSATVAEARGTGLSISGNTPK